MHRRSDERGGGSARSTSQERKSLGDQKSLTAPILRTKMHVPKFLMDQILRSCDPFSIHMGENEEGFELIEPEPRAARSPMAVGSKLKTPAMTSAQYPILAFRILMS